MRRINGLNAILQFFKDRRYELLTIAVMIISAAVLSDNISSAFSGFDHNANNGAFYSLIAKNFLQYGLLKTHFAMAQDIFPVRPEPHAFYIHHPPLLALAVALFFRIFGEHEWAARLVPISLSVASLPLVFLIGRELWGKRAGFIATTVFAIAPMFRIYGRMVNFEPVLTFFIVLFVFSYLQWTGGKKRYLWVMCGALFLGGLTDWPIFFLLPLLGLHYVAFGKKSGWAVLPGLAAVSVFGALYIQLCSLPANLYDDLIKILLFRTNAGTTSAGSKITLQKLFSQLYAFSDTCFTLPLLALGACGPIAALNPRYGDRKKRFFGFSLLLGLFGFCLANVVVFRNGSYIHNYWNYYALAPLALSAGVVLDSAAMLMPRRLSLLPVVAGVLALAIVAGEKIQAHTLHVNESAANYRAFEAQAAALTKPGSLVLTSLANYGDFTVPHAAYYYRINVVGDNNTLPVFQSSLRVHPSATLMVVEPNRTDTELLRYLDEHYSSEKAGGFSYYKLDKAK